MADEADQDNAGEDNATGPLKLRSEEVSRLLQDVAALAPPRSVRTIRRSLALLVRVLVSVRACDVSRACMVGVLRWCLSGWR